LTGARATARHLAEHEGTVYAFCSIGCRTRFIKDPAAYLAAPGTSGMTAATDAPVSSDA
jgi:Cu+-exporting ATPase